MTPQIKCPKIKMKIIEFKQIHCFNSTLVGVQTRSEQNRKKGQFPRDRRNSLKIPSRTIQTKNRRKSESGRKGQDRGRL